MATDNAALVQGSPAWVNARLGKTTSSNFWKVLTEAKSKAAREAGELSKTARSYMLDLAVESLTGQPQESFTGKATEWGNKYEPVARELYEERMGCEVQQVGFHEHPLDPMIGGSPDGLVGEDGGIEIKCPYNSAVHLGYRLSTLDGVLPKDHVAQVQGHLWISGRKWWDFVSFDHRIKDLRIALCGLRVYRDPTFMRLLDRTIFAFRYRLLGTLYDLKTGETKHG